jgi:hypothetical protein
MPRACDIEMMNEDSWRHWGATTENQRRDDVDVVDKTGSPGWTRTSDILITGKTPSRFHHPTISHPAEIHTRRPDRSSSQCVEITGLWHHHGTTAPASTRPRRDDLAWLRIRYTTAAVRVMWLTRIVDALRRRGRLVPPFLEPPTPGFSVLRAVGVNRLHFHGVQVSGATRHRSEKVRLVARRCASSVTFS